MQLVPTQAIPWAAAATDPPKLRSLLLFGDTPSYRHCTLHAHPEGVYAVSHELGRDARPEQYARLTLYGNTQHVTTQHWRHAAQQILSDLPLPDSVKGSAIPHAAVGPLTEVFEQQGWRRTYCQPCHQVTSGPPTVSAAEAAQHSLPPECQLGVLSQDDAPLVDSLWTFRSAGSLSLIRELIASSHTSCVRLQDGSPVAWMLEVEPLCGGMLHVSEQHRRKGLARVVCLDLLSKLHSRWTAIQQEQQADVARVVGDPVGHGVYVYVVEDNEPSRRLMQALDMRHTGMFTWLGFERTASTS